VKLRLTQAKIAALVSDPKNVKDTLNFDSEQRGLVLRVGPKAEAGSREHKSFFVQYTVQGVKRLLPLASATAINLDIARKQALAVMAQVAAGVDPAADRASRRRAARDALTLEKLLASWVKLHLQAHKSERYGAEAPRALRKAFEKQLSRPAAELDRGVIVETIGRAPAQAGRSIASYGSALFGWAAKQSLVPSNPFENLPVAPPSQRERVLSNEEIHIIGQALEGMGEFGSIARLLFLTGQRLSEVGSMSWDEVDLGAGRWVLPATRTKNNREHLVTLSPAALAIIRAQGRPASGEGYVFPSFGGKNPSSFAWSKKALDKKSGVQGFTLHDIRRTVATGLQGLGIRLEVTEAVLNHTSGSRAGVVGVYQRHKYENEKRAALNAWADKLTAIFEGRHVTSDNVVALRGA
jgi:integrase